MGWGILETHNSCEQIVTLTKHQFMAGLLCFCLCVIVAHVGKPRHPEFWCCGFAVCGRFQVVVESATAILPQLGHPGGCLNFYFSVYGWQMR